MFKYRPFAFIQKIALFIFVIYIGSCPSLSAAIIQFTSGKIIESEITYRDEEMIKVDSGYGIDISYYYDEIELIDGQPPIPREESIKVNASIKEIKITESIEILESISLRDSSKEVEAIEEEKPVIEPEPIKNINVVEDQIRIKELPSPFGPTIRENNRVAANAPSVVQKIEKPLPEEKSQDHLKNLKMLVKKKFVGVKSFLKKQANNFTKNNHYFQKNLTFIQAKLAQIPIQVRKDILVVLGSGVLFLCCIICFPLMLIAKKLNRKHIWLTWVPIVQIFYFTYIAGKPLGWSILFLIPFVNVILFFIFFISIIRQLEKSSWLVVPILLPGINIFVLWYLACSNRKQNQLRLKGMDNETV